MAQLIVRNLDEDVKSRLQRRARRNGRSTEEEVRIILRTAVKGEGTTRVRLGSRLAARFGGEGIEGEIEELRGQDARPAAIDR